LVFNGRAGTDNAFDGGDDEILFEYFAPSRRTDRLTRAAGIPLPDDASAVRDLRWQLS
jgi:hypothetical protein